MTVVPLLFSTFWLVNVLNHQAIIHQLLPYQWFLLAGFIALAMALALVPPTFLAVALGYFLGWVSIFPLFVLNLIAIVLIFLFTKKLDKNKLMMYLSENQKVNDLISRLKQNQWQVIFYAKLSPALPFALTNVVFTLLGSSLRNMLLGGVLGMIPRTILAVWTGSQAKVLSQALQNPNQGFWPQTIVFVLIIISFWGLGYVFKKA